MSVATRRRQWLVVGVVALLAIAFFVIQALGNATLYFRTADEAIAQRTSLGEKRFRIEGLVKNDSIHTEGSFTDFAIESKGTSVDVRNAGQPVGIFREGIPVVLEGRFRAGGNVFESDRLLVKHTADYEAKNPGRVSGTQNK